MDMMDFEALKDALIIFDEVDQIALSEVMVLKKVYFCHHDSEIHLRSLSVGSGKSTDSKGVKK